MTTTFINDHQCVYQHHKYYHSTAKIDHLLIGSNYSTIDNQYWYFLNNKNYKNNLYKWAFHQVKLIYEYFILQTKNRFIEFVFLVMFFYKLLLILLTTTMLNGDKFCSNDSDVTNYLLKETKLNYNRHILPNRPVVVRIELWIQEVTSVSELTQDFEIGLFLIILRFRKKNG